MNDPPYHPRKKDGVEYPPYRRVKAEGVQMRKWNGKLPRPELTNNFWPKSLWEEQHTDTGSDVTGALTSHANLDHARPRISAATAR